VAGAALITIVSRSEDLPGSGSGAGQVGCAVVIHPHPVATSPSSVALRLSTTLAPVLSVEPTTLEAYEVGSSGGPGLDYHVCFGSEGSMRVSEIWDSREHLEAFGERMMPILTDAGIEFSGEPEIFEVHNIIKR
jgi:hypothetical protein